jgi:hypothetical protein
MMHALVATTVMSYKNGCCPNGPSWRDNRNVLGLILDLTRLRPLYTPWFADELEDLVWTPRPRLPTVKHLESLRLSYQQDLEDTHALADLSMVALDVALLLKIDGHGTMCSCASDSCITYALRERAREWDVLLVEAKWRYLDWCGEVSADLRAAFEACWLAGERGAAHHLLVQEFPSPTRGSVTP